MSAETEPPAAAAAAEAETRVWSDWVLDVGLDQALRGQGADAAVLRQRRPRLVAIAEQAALLGARLVAPRVACRRVSVQAVRHEQMWLRGGGRLSGGPLVEHLAPAQEVVLLVCTLGAALEQQVSQVLRQDPSLGLALDGYGTAALEALSAAACARLEAEAAEAGLHTSVPLGPGMVGWPVDVGQPEIFSQLDTRGIDVALNDSGQMRPLKSTSMVLGLGLAPFSAGRICDFCALRETCRYQDRQAHYGGAASA